MKIGLIDVDSHNYPNLAGNNQAAPTVGEQQDYFRKVQKI